MTSPCCFFNLLLLLLALSLEAVYERREIVKRIRRKNENDKPQGNPETRIQNTHASKFSQLLGGFSSGEGFPGRLNYLCHLLSVARSPQPCTCWKDAQQVPLSRHEKRLSINSIPELSLRFYVFPFTFPISPLSPSVYLSFSLSLSQGLIFPRTPGNVGMPDSHGTSSEQQLVSAYRILHFLCFCDLQWSLKRYLPCHLYFFFLRIRLFQSLSMSFPSFLPSCLSSFLSFFRSQTVLAEWRCGAIPRILSS